MDKFNIPWSPFARQNNSNTGFCTIRENDQFSNNFKNNIKS